MFEFITFLNIKLNLNFGINKSNFWMNNFLNGWPINWIKILNQSHFKTNQLNFWPLNVIIDWQIESNFWINQLNFNVWINPISTDELNYNFWIYESNFWMNKFNKYIEAIQFGTRKLNFNFESIHFELNPIIIWNVWPLNPIFEWINWISVGQFVCLCGCVGVWVCV